MRAMNLMQDLEFHSPNPYAQPLFADKVGRVLRFTLKPGQSVTEHYVPDSPFYVVVLKGEGMFMGRDDKEKRLGPNQLLIFDPGEKHSIQAIDTELVFVGFLHGALGVPVKKVTGKMAQKRKKISIEQKSKRKAR